MNLIRRLSCSLMGHDPVLERRGDDCVLPCERCHRLFEVFVKDLYGTKPRRPHGASLAEGNPLV